MTPRVERRIAAFLEWESRGRGNLLWNHRVRLEPPFVPFDRDSDMAPAVDDGQFDTLGTRFFGWLAGPLNQEAGSENAIKEGLTTQEVEPLLDESEEPVVELEIALPQSSSISRELAERFLLSLQQCRFPISFEVVGRPNRVAIQIAGREPDVAQIRRQLEAHFPDVSVTIAGSPLGDLWAEESPSLVFDLGLEKEFLVPLMTVGSLSHDPLIGIVGAFTDLREQEIGLLQILFEPVRQPWSASMLRSVTNADGSGFFSNAPDLVSQTRRKTEKPLYATVCRIAVQSENYDRVLEVASGLAGAISIVNSPTGNELIPLNNDAYDFDLHVSNLLDRRTHRSGMVLNLDELVSLVHLPNSTVRIPKLVRDAKRTKASPSIAAGNPILLGENHHAGEKHSVTVNDEHRLRHTHVIGSSGSGKSTFLINQIRQDIKRGSGLAVFDPHGDLIDQVIAYIPEERFDDVILFDPSDDAFPVGLNILSAHSEIEKNLLASDLVSVFRRLSTSWGDQMTAVLRNAILAMLESTRGGTLFDLRRFLVEPEFREDFLQSVTDSQVNYFWTKEFPMLAGRPSAPLLTRLNTFLGPRLIRNMVAQRNNSIDFADVMDGRKIFLAKLSQGTLGEENSYLMGSLLVAKFYQLVMSRQAIEVADRQHFWLYIDEFHNFICDSMASILTGARKYGLGLTMAHQELKQIEFRDSNVAGAVLANPFTRVCFRLGDDDARKLASGFSYFESSDLQNLGVGEAICRIERSQFDFNLTIPLPPKVVPEVAKKKYVEIRERTRERYASSRSQVEEQINRDLADVAVPIVQPKSAPEGSVQTRLPRKPVVDTVSESEKPLKSKIDQEAENKPDTFVQKVEESEQPEPQESEKHEAIKDRIRQVAERHDFTVSTEQLVLDGRARIDVVLTRGTRQIAIQIGITTPAKHEAANIRKCLDAGFKEIYMIALTRKRLDAIREASISLAEAKAFKKVRFTLPCDFFENFDGWAEQTTRADRPDPRNPRKQKFDFKEEGYTETERMMLEKLAETMRGRKTKD